MKIISKTLVFLIAIILSAGCLSKNNKESAVNKNEKIKETKLLLGVQAYTFHYFTFQEAINKANTLGLDFIEAYYGQPLGDSLGEGKFSYNMDDVTIQKILNYAKKRNVKILSSGVVIPKDSTEWEQLFKFAKHMGIRIITSEPKYEHLQFIDSLANVYDIDIAIHNHPYLKSNYFKPDLFLEHVQGLSNHIGACVDIGHLKRLDIDPVEALKKYDGRIKEIHFKDIAPKIEGEKEQPDVIWGEGVIDIPGVLKELKRQNFHGLITIEYESNWYNSVPDIAKSIEYFKSNENNLPVI